MHQLREWWWWWVQLTHADRLRIRRLRLLKLVTRNALYEADHHRLGASAVYRRGKKS